MSFIQWWSERGPKSHVAKETSGRGRRRIREKPGNQGVGDFRFTNILRLFSIYFSFFFQLLYIITFFLYFFTHDSHDPHPRPTTFSYTLSFVVLCKWYNGSIADNLCEVPAGSFEIFELEKFRKKCNEALRNQLEEDHLTRQKRCTKDSPAESGLNDRLKKNPPFMSRFSLQKNAEVTFTLLVCLLISS